MPPSANPIRAAIATALRVTFKDSADKLRIEKENLLQGGTESLRKVEHFGDLS
jgi:hypothetical protein